MADFKLTTPMIRRECWNGPRPKNCASYSSTRDASQIQTIADEWRTAILREGWT
jgi:hypothetical protein